MQPPKCNHEHEIAAAIERLEEKYRALPEDDRDMKFPDLRKMTALRMTPSAEIQTSVRYRDKNSRHMMNSELS